MTRVFSQTFGVAGAIIKKNGKFCLVKENSGPDKNKYNQPSGWIELGENPINAVKKEVLEETGFIFKPTGIVGIFSLERKDLMGKIDGSSEHIFPHPIKIIFRGEILGENKSEFQNEEISSIERFTAEEIYNMNQDKLRDIDIKKEVEAYENGNNFPIDIIFHTVQN